ncbi:hypothetical protein [Motilimonas sp. KMU-193]|uniref:YhdP family protein n=1 Tax=Motilimonas sp. KMU-193 TaxID=3388668 RepID=UPI00396AF43B
MSPTGRLVIRLCAGLLLTVFVIISLFALLFDANDYRDDIKHWAKTQWGYDLAVENIVWNLTEPTLLTFEQLNLSSPDQAQPIAIIPKAWLRLSTQGWFAREFSIEQIIVEDPQFHIADGALSAAAQASQTTPSTTDHDPLGIKSLNIEKIAINHLTADIALSSMPPIKVSDLTLNLHDLKIIADHKLLAQDTELDLELAIVNVAIRDVDIQDVFVAASLQQQQLSVAKLSGQHRKGKLRSTLELNIVPPISMQVDQLELTGLNIEYNQALLDNFLPIEPHPQAQPAAVTSAEQAILENLKIKAILLDDISFTSYEANLPLTFNKLAIDMKNLPLLSAGHWLDLSQVEQLDSLFNLSAREVYFAGTSITDLMVKSRVQSAKWDFYQVQGNSFDGHFSALFDLSLQRYPDIHIKHFTARDLDIGIQPQWLTPADKVAAEPSLLPINQLNIDKLDLYNLNLLSFADDLPLSVRGVSLNLTNAQLVKDRRALSIPPQWSQAAEFELTINETLYQGMKADRLSIKGKLNEDFLNPMTLQQLVPSTPVVVEGVTIDQPETSVIRLD